MCSPNPGRPPNQGQTHRSAPSDNVQWFKTMSTNEYIHGVKAYQLDGAYIMRSNENIWA
jgi:hypothetical protein